MCACVSFMMYAIGSACLCHSILELQACTAMPSFLHRYRGFEFRSSYFYSECFHPLSHPPNTYINLTTDHYIGFRINIWHSMLFVLIFRPACFRHCAPCSSVLLVWISQSCPAGSWVPFSEIETMVYKVCLTYGSRTVHKHPQSVQGPGFSV